MELFDKLKTWVRSNPPANAVSNLFNGVLDTAVDLIDGLFPGALTGLVHALGGTTKEEYKLQYLDDLDKKVTEAIAKLPPADASKINAALNRQSKALALQGKTFAHGAVRDIQKKASQNVTNAQKEYDAAVSKRESAVNRMYNIRNAADIITDKGYRFGTDKAIDSLANRIENIPNNFEQGV